MVKDGDAIAVWFSCGAASAVAAKMTVEKYGARCAVRVLNNPIKEEDDDNQRFLRDVSDWIGRPVETVTANKYPASSVVEVWDTRKFMSGPLGAPCTIELKKVARQEWERNNRVDWHVLGFTADERRRHDRFVLTERDNVLPVLIDANITKQDCYAVLKNAGVRLPRIYSLGYPNANCIGCVKATSPTYWNLVRKTHPEVFAARAEQSRRLGARLTRVKNERMFLDELPATAKGRSIKNLDFECGIFCEERN
jgi:hypothetical protein